MQKKQDLMAKLQDYAKVNVRGGVLSSDLFNGEKNKVGMEIQKHMDALPYTQAYQPQYQQPNYNEQGSGANRAP